MITPTTLSSLLRRRLYLLARVREDGHKTEPPLWGVLPSGTRTSPNLPTIGGRARTVTMSLRSRFAIAQRIILHFVVGHRFFIGGHK